MSGPLDQVFTGPLLGFRHGKGEMKRSVTPPHPQPVRQGKPAIDPRGQHQVINLFQVRTGDPGKVSLQHQHGAAVKAKTYTRKFAAGLSEIQRDPGGVLRAKTLKDLVGQVFKHRLVGREYFRCGVQSFSYGRIIRGEVRETFPADTVAEKSNVTIAAVVTPGKPPEFEVVNNFRPRQPEQWPDIPAGRQGTHPAKARSAGAPQKPQQKSLGLVVRMVPQGYASCPKLFRQFVEPLIAGSTAGLFQGKPSQAANLTHIGSY